ncbi:hypothetical protein PMAYCL1PPCAC_08095, partial [Pristionchus mayeri]
DETLRRPFECADCGKRFTQLVCLLNHRVFPSPLYSNILQPHIDDPRLEKFHCELCSKIFRSKQALQRHSKSHLEQAKIKRPFKCEQCGKSFMIAQTLKAHLTTHIDDEEARLPHQCEECGKRFNSSGNLSTHKISIHLRIIERSHPFQCNECGKRFYSSTNLKVHMNLHI